MRNLKKFLALVLVFMMAMSLMATASAVTLDNVKFSDSDAVTAKFEEDLLVVNGMGVIKGYTDGSFQPKGEITRAEMAAIVYRMSTGDVEDKYVHNYVGYNTFSDVADDAWYAGYIGYCENHGIIQGYPDGTFKPAVKVTGYQSLAMILRAVGYNQPGHNFVGEGWETYTSAIATQRGMLKNVEQTAYAGSLRQPAKRELVGELAFQGLNIAQVQWTSALSYQTTGMDGYPGSGNQNPTLGLQNFGLTNHKGIIVGNQGSGESFTKVGFSLDVTTQKGLNIGMDSNDWVAATPTGWQVSGSVTGAKINDTLAKEAYYYTSTLAVDPVANKVVGNVTLSFQYDTNLDMFNHAVDVWYDCRGTDNSYETVSLEAAGTVNTDTGCTYNPAGSAFNAGSVTFSNNLKTYAMFDRTNSVKVDMAKNWNWEGNTGDINKVFNTDDATLYNYAFARMERETVGTAASPIASHNYIITSATAGPDKSAKSPIMANNGEDTYNNPYTEGTDTHPLYLAIENDGDKVDVIISLDLTMTKVVQDNNTQKPFTTGVVTQNSWSGNGAAGVTNATYFDKWEYKKPTNNAAGYSDIADEHMLKSDAVKLGDYVSAMTVTGTNGGNTGKADAAATLSTAASGADSGNAGNINSAMKSNYWYNVKKLTSTVVGTMIKYDQGNDKVWISVDGEVKEYARSVFALATDGSFKDHKNVFAPRDYITATFYLDEDGKWMFWEQGGSKAEFAYGTYVNYQTGEFGGKFSYPFVYVSESGEKNQTAYINKLTMNDGDGRAFDGTMSNDGYSEIQLPKRTDTAGNSSGFVRGEYVGYAMTRGDNNLVSLNGDVSGTGFRQAGNTATAAGPEGYNDFGTGSTKTTINGDSVAITAQAVGGTGRLFLTERTKFIIVDGAGTQTQTVDIYNGLSGLLGDNDKVVIDATTPILKTDSTYLADNKDGSENDINDPWKMVYYSLEEDPYSQDYYMMDMHIDTVFIPKQLVSWTPKADAGNLWFVGNTANGLIDAGTDATQFTFHQGTESKVLWIAGQKGGTNDRARGNANVVGDTANKDTFYWLFDTGEKAKDGEPIYTINTVAQTDTAKANATLIGFYYPGTTIVAGADNDTAGTRAQAENPTGTVRTAITSGTSYTATTRNSQVAYICGRDSTKDLYNVSGATVLNLNTSYTINSLGDLNEASSNTSNTGIAVSCVVDGKAVQNIYVNFVSVTP